MYAVPQNLRVTKTNDGALVLAIETGKVLRLNPTGLFIFERLQIGASETEIIDTLTEQFGILRQVAGQDTREFLKHLQQLGVIYDSDEASSLAAG